MSVTNVFDLLFSGEVKIDQVKKLRFELAKRIYDEESVDIDRYKWDYVYECLSAPLIGQPTALHSFIVLFCITQHSSLQDCVRRQFLRNPGSYNPRQTGKPAEVFFNDYIVFLQYCRDDFISTDPYKTDELWPKTMNMMRYAWNVKMIQRPWNSVTIRCITPADFPAIKKRTRNRTTALKRAKMET